ncbi:hypothetical protein OROMI_029868 [Orobanche minor]
MEVISCSGKFDCPDGKSDSLRNGEPVRTDMKVDGLTLDVGVSHEIREDGQFILDSYEFDVDGENLSSRLHDFNDDNSDKRDHFAGWSLMLENSDLVLDTVESEQANNDEEGSYRLEIQSLEQDEPQAVWVKWRGKWQSGIRCARADWPLSTLKAKPTHDRKQYLVIFFPRTRNYSWADVLLVRPINEFPEPIAYKTHKIGVDMVEDLSLARRFITQKLAVSMLNILDQLNREAFVETAGDVMVLKDFAMEASRCKDYSDLGRMLLKLQNMILQRCLTSDWLHQSLQSWKQRCQNANSAESIEILKEELTDSILWNEVNLLTSEASPLDPGSGGKSWKHEVMKWFSVSHPVSTDMDPGQPFNNNTPSTGPQTANKRAKLEVRRADTHASTSHSSIPIETDSTFFNNYDFVNTALFESETPNKNGPVGDANKWNEIVVEAAGNLSPTSVVTQKSVGLGNHNRQCMAFIESKGRQCVRYASEGDAYCCVHLSSHFVANSAKKAEKITPPPVDSPMCGGTTVLGTKCKHRALVGSSFCKKHRPRDGERTMSPVSLNQLKRKIDEDLLYPESKSPTMSMVAREDEDLMSAARVDQLFIKIPEPTQQPPSCHETVRCVGLGPDGGEEEPCLDSPKRHSLYCEKHIPNWLKRARNGKSRILSKEVFIELLRNCPLREQKLQLHRACELFYRLLKSILSLRNPVPKEVQFQWAIAEASKDVGVGEFLMKLVRHEKDRLNKNWDVGDGQNLQSSSTVEEPLVLIPLRASNDSGDHENVFKCKICNENLLDDQALGKHWMDSHKKEAQWLFRGYVCAICLDSFTNRKILEAHVQERHHVQFVEQCMLLQCIPCGSHFGKPDQLWLHVLSTHPTSLRLSNECPQQDKATCQKVEQDKPENTVLDNQLASRRFICRFCGLKFDLLPDLGRHHQAAHMGCQNLSTGPRLTKKGMQFYAHKLKSGRLARPHFKKALTSASYKIRNRSMQNLKKRIQASSSFIGPLEVEVQSAIPESDTTLGRLADSQCSSIARLLISEIKKTKARPSNSEVLSLATSACCKVSLQALLEVKYGILPERLYLKAAKLCSEHNISIEWHQEGFVCPKGCKPSVRLPILPPLVPSSGTSFKARSNVPSNLVVSEWTMDECHCVIDPRHFSMDLSERNIVLCDDISFGREAVPIACVVDEVLLNDEGNDGLNEYSFPWESFSYVTKPMFDKSVVPESESLQLGCSCAHSMCSSESCDHVYLFDNDYEDAKDIHGKPMHGRFPYDERGRIILEGVILDKVCMNRQEGYLVYECNQRCCCSRGCRNRVLQNGMHVKLEIFKTEEKGWAVRTREAILRGTFVCEYIGEVIDEKEANERRNRYGEEGCRFMYEIDAHINDMSRLIEGQVPYVIDATNYGNVSRYINHCCSPNLVNYQVLVESMDSQLARIGLYASRDIAVGEELTYDYSYKPMSGEALV